MDPCLRRDPTNARGNSRFPAPAGTLFTGEGAVAGWIPACVGIRQTRGAIRGSLRRQEPFSPAKERLQDGSLPSQGPDKRAGKFGVPAKAGTISPAKERLQDGSLPSPGS